MLTIISLNMSTSPKFRCVMALVVFNFVSSSGKIILTGKVMKDIVKGPINNTFKNSAQAYQTAMCQYNVYKKVAEISKKRQEARRGFMDKFKLGIQQIKAKKQALNTLSNGIKNELTSEDDGSFSKHKLENFVKKNFDYDFDVKIIKKPEKKGSYAQKYREKKIKNCIEIFKSGSNTCENGANLVSEENRGKTSLFTLSISTDHCKMENTELKKNPRANCEDNVQQSDYNGMDNDLKNLDAVNRKLNENFDNDIKINTKMTNKNIISKDSILSVKSDIMNVKAKASWVSSCIEKIAKVVQLFANLSYTLVVFRSFLYHSKYLSDIDFDNFCITKYFEHIDNRRRNYKKPVRTLLPLKPHEKEILHFPFAPFVSAYQKPVVKINVFLYSFMIVLFLTSVIFDYLLYDFLDILIQNLVFDMIPREPPKQKKEIKGIRGNGSVARMLQSMFNGTNEEEQFSYKEIKEIDCTPIITKMGSNEIIVLTQQIILLVLLIVLELYVKRFNRNICAYFYPKREKKRILWLFNECIKRREAFYQNAKERIYIQVQNDLMTSKDKFKFLKKFKVFSNLFKKLEKFPLFKKSCDICDKKKKIQIFACKLCGVNYCDECWFEYEQKCVGCSPKFTETKKNED
ncbi:unnamed protein product [Brachionus calyciflorus]|uniref:Dendritic cell-specific transmembrane protein-like domain-containing protein n=1 Tax=Brachionus calyciflorus TaxID=104777 RepID=A0A814EQ09_9BILA|nr:unnamed protein product [Brachionus calyciflorus]